MHLVEMRVIGGSRTIILVKTRSEFGMGRLSSIAAIAAAISLMSLLSNPALAEDASDKNTALNTVTKRSTDTSEKTSKKTVTKTTRRKPAPKPYVHFVGFDKMF